VVVPIPTNDLWVAAGVLQHGFAVFSDDGHFHQSRIIRYMKVQGRPLTLTC
jgi:predicted nucleic acid-binding protein